MKSKGPSPTQRAVLQAVLDGWELGREETMDGTFWIQQGGLCKGGASKEVRNSTGFALLQNGWIKMAKRNWPTVHYVLTAKGEVLASE